MVSYKCFYCENAIKQEYLRKRVRCPYCGNRVLFKQRNIATTVEAV